jgi:hypothetical protein
MDHVYHHDVRSGRARDSECHLRFNDLLHCNALDGNGGQVSLLEALLRALACWHSQRWTAWRQLGGPSVYTVSRVASASCTKAAHQPSDATFDLTIVEHPAVAANGGARVGSDRCTTSPPPPAASSPVLSVLKTAHRAMPLKTGVLLVAASLWIFSFAFAQSTDDPAKLKEQIEQLRRENQLLRSLLAQSQAPPAATPAQRVAATGQTTSTVATNTQQQELTHWLTTASNKRHNSSCRWYKASNGRPCRADEGIPCKKCGG